MTFDEYRKKAMATAIYPAQAVGIYSLFGLGGEFIEFWEKAHMRAVLGNCSINEIRKEAGDVLWMAAAVASDYDLDCFGFQTEVTTNYRHILILMNELFDLKAKALRDTKDGEPSPAKMQEAFTTLMGHLIPFLERISEATVDHIYEMNLEKLASRQKRGVLGGSGDNR